jgi:hypothetical protein
LEFVDPMGLSPERTPVKALPVPILQVNKNGENEKDDRTHHDALFVHEGDRSAKSRFRGAGYGTFKGK